MNDCQIEIEKEKGTDEDHGHEKEESRAGVHLLVHDHDLRPTLKSDALKHVEKCPEDVVKVGYIIVRIERLFATVEANWTLNGTAQHLSAF